MASFMEFEAKNVDKAVLKAVDKLGIPKSKINYDVISYGSTGIFGLVSSKKAKIRVKLMHEVKPSTNDSRTQDAEILNDVKSVVEEVFGKDEVDIATDLEKPNGIEQPSPVEPLIINMDNAENPEDSDISTCDDNRDDNRDDNEDTMDSDLDDDNQDDYSQDEDEDVSLNTISQEEAVQLGQTVLGKILDTITTDVEIETNLTKDAVMFNIKGGNSGVIIGKRGQTLEAIQYLIEKVINTKSNKRIRIQIDVAGYLESKKASLKNLALKLAEKARRTGKPAAMGQMNAYDRKTVHLALKDFKGVRTQSMGNGYYRKLMIFPNRNRNQKSK